MASATIVWSMNIIATARIIAASTRVRLEARTPALYLPGRANPKSAAAYDPPERPPHACTRAWTNCSLSMTGSASVNGYRSSRPMLRLTALSA